MKSFICAKGLELLSVNGSGFDIHQLADWDEMLCGSGFDIHQLADWDEMLCGSGFDIHQLPDSDEMFCRLVSKLGRICEK